MRDLLGRGLAAILLVLALAPATIAAVTAGAGAAKTPEQAPYVAGGEMQNFTVHEAPRAVADIRFKDAAGGDLSLADFKGRVVLLNLWATWCAPCRREMPDIDALQAKYGGPDFVVGPQAPAAERNILGVIAKVGLEIAGQVIKVRKECRDIIRTLGGKVIHPVFGLPGGVSRGMSEEEREKWMGTAHFAVEFAQFALQIFDDVVLATIERK